VLRYAARKHLYHASLVSQFQPAAYFQSRYGMTSQSAAHEGTYSFLLNAILLQCIRWCAGVQVCRCACLSTDPFGCVGVRCVVADWKRFMEEGEGAKAVYWTAAWCG
jgi:hypothetical protein